MIRLFVALKIPDEALNRLLDIRNSRANEELNIKWEPKEKLHLTLKFIGEVQEELIPQIKNELKFIEDFSEIKCEINKFGLFYRFENPSILWAGLQCSKTLELISEELNNKLQSIGVEKENRKFKPHLTLLRVKKSVDEDLLNKFKNYNLNPILFKGKKISLIKSDLKKGGSVYTELENYKLKTMEV